VYSCTQCAAGDEQVTTYGWSRRPHWQSVSHSTHTRQVPFGDGKEVDRELQRGTMPGTPASATHKDQSALLVGSPLMVIHTVTILRCTSGCTASQVQVYIIMASSVVY
jgi:hypothetical protein